ncbi:hypothetical protein [Actinoplanes awajinensis]|uniref:Uncharacterized protein n=1 Tax=Actinoplanes awajinensis subsp. mycoplanecinus TaxID=135947 RepID=A0A117MKG8_9ACTN|nr:hypothetical protein [Actinoplanes awajinensis]KUL22327.1 hypothetical protein ADL15_48190 [Actinoplanes awajinensis subsp. mycoplanecinus]
MTTNGRDEALGGAARWLLRRVWAVCVLSGAYVTGHHLGWPRTALTVAAILGAVAVAAAVVLLPTWSRERPTGVPLLDVGLRLVVWTGIAVGVLALLVSEPALGAAAGALLLTAVWRTFARPPVGAATN